MKKLLLILICFFVYSCEESEESEERSDNLTGKNLICDLNYLDGPFSEDFLQSGPSISDFSLFKMGIEFLTSKQAIVYIFSTTKIKDEMLYSESPEQLRFKFFFIEDKVDYLTTKSLVKIRQKSSKEDEFRLINRVGEGYTTLSRETSEIEDDIERGLFKLRYKKMKETDFLGERNTGILKSFLYFDISREGLRISPYSKNEDDNYPFYHYDPSFGDFFPHYKKMDVNEIRDYVTFPPVFLQVNFKNSCTRYRDKNLKQYIYSFYEKEKTYELNRIQKYEKELKKKLIEDKKKKIEDKKKREDKRI